MFISMDVKCVVVVVLLSIATVVFASEKPIFSRQSICNSFISKSETWYSGCPTTLAVLNKDEYLTIHIETSGDVVSTAMTLNYYCPDSTSSETKTLSQKEKLQEFCTNMGFSIEHKSSNAGQHVYQLTLTKSSLDISRVFTSATKLIVYVTGTTSSGKTFQLSSKPLQIYSLNPLINSEHFLTPTARKFFNSTPYADDRDFPEIPFFHDTLLKHLEAMKDTFFENFLQIGGLINLESKNCEKDSNSQLLIVNRLTTPDLNYYLNSTTGTLTFSKIGIAKQANTLAKSVTNRWRSICFYVDFTNSKLKKERKSDKVDYDATLYKAAPQDNNCVKVDGNNDNKKVTIYSGILEFVLKCPFVCSYSPYIEVKHGSKNVIDVASVGEAKSDKNNIVFPKIVTKKNAGIYTCEVTSQSGRLSHQFHVNVVILPTFKDTTVSSIDGNLPSVVYAMEGETMSYSCSVFYTGVSVTLSAEFFTFEPDKGWSGDSGPLDSNKYNNYLGCDSCVTVNSTTKKHELFDKNTMTLQVSKVPPMDKSTIRNFTHRFECHASVDATDLTPLMMKDYIVTSGANIFYIPIPDSYQIIASPKNNCSVQGCEMSSGATFSYIFKQNFTNYLKKIGVKVTGYFMLGNDNIDQFPYVKKKINVTFLDKDYSLKLTVPPITVEDTQLLKEFKNRKTLTAVFNFAYNVNSLTGVTMDKSRYGENKVADDADCRSEKFNTCFYSTAFPSYLNKTTMSFLTNYIEFKGKIPEPEPTQEPKLATGNTGMIVGILIAILIILFAVCLVAYLLTRDRGQTYLVDEKERLQGNNPELEVKEEQFKEYQRPEEGTLRASRMSICSSITVGSDDDHELDRYGDGDIDLTKFTEDGSFIGDYAPHVHNHNGHTKSLNYNV